MIFLKTPIFILSNRMEQIRSSMRISESLDIFKKHILQFTSLSKNFTYNCPSSIVLKYLTRLHLGLRHLCENNLSTVFLFRSIQYAVVVLILNLLAIG